MVVMILVNGVSSLSWAFILDVYVEGVAGAISKRGIG